jgi:hypothetical protein
VAEGLVRRAGSAPAVDSHVSLRDGTGGVGVPGAGFHPAGRLGAGRAVRRGSAGAPAREARRRRGCGSGTGQCRGRRGWGAWVAGGGPGVAGCPVVVVVCLSRKAVDPPRGQVAGLLG